MGRLTLKARRNFGRGLNKFDNRYIGGRNFVNVAGIGNRASLTTALAGANNDITLLARAPGTNGNAITFRIVVAGASTPLSVSVSTNAITVNSATSAGSAAISTADQIIDAVNRSATASALVWAQRAAANDGTGVVVAVGATNLAGGV